MLRDVGDGDWQVEVVEHGADREHARQVDPAQFVQVQDQLPRGRVPGDDVDQPVLQRGRRRVVQDALRPDVQRAVAAELGRYVQAQLPPEVDGDGQPHADEHAALDSGRGGQRRGEGGERDAGLQRGEPPLADEDPGVDEGERGGDDEAGEHRARQGREDVGHRERREHEQAGDGPDHRLVAPAARFSEERDSDPPVG